MERLLNKEYYISIYATYYNIPSLGSIGNQNVIYKANDDLTSNNCIGFTDAGDFNEFINITFCNDPINDSSNFWDFENAPNLYYGNTTSIYNRSFQIYDYVNHDVTEWIWPKFYWDEAEQWNYPLPKYILENTYSI